MANKYPVRSLRHALLSGVFGVLLTAFLFLAPTIASWAGAERLSRALFMMNFWTAGIFGLFFDWLSGTKSYWMPNPLGFLAAILFNVILLSFFSCSVLWMLGQFRHGGDVEDV